MLAGKGTTCGGGLSLCCCSRGRWNNYKAIVCSGCTHLSRRWLLQNAIHKVKSNLTNVCVVKSIREIFLFEWMQ